MVPASEKAAIEKNKQNKTKKTNKQNEKTKQKQKQKTKTKQTKNKQTKTDNEEKQLLLSQCCMGLCLRIYDSTNVINAKFYAFHRYNVCKFKQRILMATSKIIHITGSKMWP